MSFARIHANLIFFVEIHENSATKLILSSVSLCCRSVKKYLLFKGKKFTAHNSEAELGMCGEV